MSASPEFCFQVRDIPTTQSHGMVGCIVGRGHSGAPGSHAGGEQNQPALLGSVETGGDRPHLVPTSSRQKSLGLEIR